MEQKTKMAAVETTTNTKNSITLKGSAELVSEFFCKKFTFQFKSSLNVIFFLKGSESIVFCISAEFIRRKCSQKAANTDWRFWSLRTKNCQILLIQFWNKSKANSRFLNWLSFFFSFSVIPHQITSQGDLRWGEWRHFCASLAQRARLLSKIGQLILKQLILNDVIRPAPIARFSMIGLYLTFSANNYAQKSDVFGFPFSHLPIACFSVIGRCASRCASASRDVFQPITEFASFFKLGWWKKNFSDWCWWFQVFTRKKFWSDGNSTSKPNNQSQMILRNFDFGFWEKQLFDFIFLNFAVPEVPEFNLIFLNFAVPEVMEFEFFSWFAVPEVPPRQRKKNRKKWFVKKFATWFDKLPLRSLFFRCSTSHVKKIYFLVAMF